jgi:hypothetical protein
MVLPPKPASGVQPLQNSPLWPPSPSNIQADSPGPQPPKGSAPPPPPSPTQDNYAHHSSPNPGNVQTPVPTPPPVNNLPPKKTIGKMPEVPMHITKHPNPVGRPKNAKY